MDFINEFVIDDIIKKKNSEFNGFKGKEIKFCVLLSYRRSFLV